MKLSKEETEVLDRMLGNGGEIIMHDYNPLYPAICELILLGLVRRMKSWSLEVPLLEKYKLTSIMLKDEEDVDFYMKFLAGKKL